MFVYKITNKINGKMYVGITSRTIEQRFKEHIMGGNLVHSAIKKYGQENFRIELLAEAFDKKELLWLEQMFIKKLNTKMPYGYNLTDGGDGVKNPSEKSRQKMREAKLGKVLSEEHRGKISSALKGIARSPETRQKMRECKESKPIMCVETGIKYESVSECARKLGLYSGNLCKVLKGERKSTGGYTFKYL